MILVAWRCFALSVATGSLATAASPHTLALLACIFGPRPGIKGAASPLLTLFYAKTNKRTDLCVWRDRIGRTRGDQKGIFNIWKAKDGNIWQVIFFILLFTLFIPGHLFHVSLAFIVISLKWILSDVLHMYFFSSLLI